MLVVGGPLDGESFAIVDNPPHPVYSLYKPPPVMLHIGADEPVPNVKIDVHEYGPVPLCWPSGALKGWVLMPRGLTDREREVLLMRKGLIDG